MSYTTITEMNSHPEERRILELANTTKTSS